MPPWCARYPFHTHGESRDLLKHLSSKVDLLDYKAHDHNMIMHRERDEHIATGRSLSLEEELLPPHHGNQQRRCRGGVTADAMDRLKVGTKCTRGIQGGIVW